MAADERTEAQIRTEIAAERRQLVVAVAGLREGVKAKKRTAVVAGAVATVAIAAVLVGRRLLRD
jgi:hypothetical protein